MLLEIGQKMGLGEWRAGIVQTAFQPSCAALREAAIEVSLRELEIILARD